MAKLKRAYLLTAYTMFNQIQKLMSLFDNKLAVFQVNMDMDKHDGALQASFQLMF